MTAATSFKLSPAHEAQQLFFEIGMRAREVAGAELARVGLTFTLAHALRLLDPGEPLAMSEVARRLACDASNVTGLADRLEKRGLIERQSAADDRRVKTLALTPAGIELRRQALEIMMRPPAAFEALSIDDQRLLRDILLRAAARAAQGSDCAVPLNR
ncbi:MAG TPA: MarR family transcriptional regulator [Tepidiformaceae bacterium]|nr:MarR family transcriptional regulator [Tepidiformaceae bacterium]